MQKSIFAERYRGMAEVLTLMLLVSLALGSVRVILMCRILEWSMLMEHVSSVPLMLYNALRYDMQVGAYAVLPLFLIAVVQLFVGVKMNTLIARVAKVYSPFVVVLVALVGMSDNHFYQNFSQHFNIVAFDFFDENPIVLLKGIIEEAPILLLLVCFAVSVVVAVYGRKLILRVIERFCSRMTRTVVFIVITTLLVPVCVRGNLGTFPLRAEDIYVSSSAAVNDCVPNGIFMLKKAWSEKKKQFKLETEQSILNSEHFSSADEALDVLRALDADTLNGELQDVMFVRTPADVVAKGYNVVLIIVESWSNLLIDYEKSLDADLLCGLRKHFDADYLFRNFVSATNGTIDAVETFTINSQPPRIFTSSYRTYQYPTATAKVWHDAGYETSFLSGIEISWRNLMEVLPKQNFDRVIGKYELLNERPEAECNTTWGVYDHELFSYLNDYINTDGAPKFVMALTSTSHTPFEFPTSFALPEIAADKLSSDNFATSEDITLEYLKGYQYENMALSRFLDNFKVSEAADSTIVVITGDHNIRQILSYRNEEPWQKYSVPLYIYLPEQLRERVSYDPSRYGSHYDIVPTLATLTVPDGTYFNTGHNLLDTAQTYPWHGVNREVVIAPPTADKTQIERIVGARKALTKIYFQRLWTTK